MMGQNTRMESKKEVGVEVKVRTMVGGEGKVRSWLDVVKGKKEETKKQTVVLVFKIETDMASRRKCTNFNENFKLDIAVAAISRYVDTACTG